MGLLYKDSLLNMINIDPLESIIILTAIITSTMFSLPTAILLTIAYILTVVSLYKNKNENIRTMLDKIVKIPSTLFNPDKMKNIKKENMEDNTKYEQKKLSKYDLIKDMGTTQLDSSIVVCPENATNKSGVIQTNLLQQLSKTQLDASKPYGNPLYEPCNNKQTGFVY